MKISSVVAPAATTIFCTVVRFVLSAQKSGKNKLEEIEKLLYKQVGKLASKDVTDDELLKAKQAITKSVRLSTTFVTSTTPKLEHNM